MRYTNYVMAVTLMLLVLCTQNFASSQLGTFSVKVDKDTYNVNESVKISGTVPAVIEGVPLTIQIFNPRNTLYTFVQIMPNEDRTYSTTIKVGGKLGIGGIYTVKATYSGQSVEAQFELYAAPIKQCLKFEGKCYEYDARMSSGSVRFVEIDPDFTSVIIGVIAHDGGELTITLPKEFFGKEFDCFPTEYGYDDLVVIVDGEEEEKRVTTTLKEVTFVVPVPGGAEEVEIVGTCIPEFGTITVLVFAAAVGAIVGLRRFTLHSNLRFP
jgi:predicted secreted protein with PEFG-CTERM motif